MQRTAEEVRSTTEEIEMLNQFCGGGIFPGASDALPTKEVLVDTMLQPLTGSADAAPVAQPCMAAPAPSAPAAGARPPKEALVVPQLPLGLLPQEHPPQEPAWPGPSSPSSASSSSSEAGLTATRPAAHVAWPPGAVRVQASGANSAGAVRVAAPPGVAMSQCAGVGLASLPQTPPLPMSTLHTPGAFLSTGAQDRPGQHLLGHYMGYVSPPVPQWSRGLDDVREADEADEEYARQGLAPPRVPTPVQGCSLTVQAAHTRPLHSEAMVADVPADCQRMRKSHSTASLRSLGHRQAVAAASAATVAVTSHTSPMAGNRSDLVGASPLRGSVGPSGKGGASSPPLPPKRPLAAAASGPATRVGAQHRPCGPRAATPAARPSGGPPAQSHSPVVLGRTVSAQALRVERVSPALKLRPAVVPPKRSPSPDQARVAITASPMRNAVLRGTGPGSPPVSTPNLALRPAVSTTASVGDLPTTSSLGS